MIRDLRLSAWIALGGGAFAGVAAGVVPAVKAPGPADVVAPAALPADLESSPSDSLVRVAVRRNLFRSSRRPAPEPYRVSVPVPPPAPAGSPKPQLRLIGLIEAASPTVIIEGFPGIEGARVLEQGAVVTGIRVAEIRPSHARLTGMDTTWVLKLAVPWQ